MTDHLPVLQAPSLHTLTSIKHAFFTRQGGVSSGPFSSLNCSLSSGDARHRVRANRRRAARHLQEHAQSLVMPTQVHGNQAVIVRSDNRAITADALVTDQPGLIMGILTADCAPVLLASESPRVVAVAHAGWRGALGGIIQATIAAMGSLGCHPHNIHAAIGPHIAQTSYDVTLDFVSPFLAQDPKHEQWFAPGRANTHKLFNLGGYITSQLHHADVRTITSMPHDTYTQEDQFFSHRRACHRGETQCGRMLSAITITP